MKDLRSGSKRGAHLGRKILVGMFAGAAVMTVTCSLGTTVAHADTAAPAPAAAVAQEKQALDATGTAGVPEDWDPSTVQAPTKQPDAAAVAMTTLSAERAVGVVTSSAVTESLAVPTTTVLAENEKAQKTEAYCDPASVHELLNDRGIALSQDDAANLLGTSATSGTPWYNGPSASVPWPTSHVLNHEQSTWDYEPVSLPDSPTAAQKTAYEDALITDMTHGWPMIGNAFEVVGGPHLVGHPNENLQHYVEIRGYHDSGATTNYEDSIHGNTQVGWYANVPAYSPLPSTTFATILGDRGYVW